MCKHLPPASALSHLPSATDSSQLPFLRHTISRLKSGLELLEMDHSNMDHGGIDHGHMGHGDMDMGGKCSMNVSWAIRKCQ